jgi:protein-glucosylgalactosylhydroxylysine glucosidase
MDARAAPISPAPAFGSGRNELPAYLSNGLIGLRVREVPFAGIAILSGYSGEHPVEGIEAAARVPFPLAGKLRVNAVRLSDAASEVGDLEQRYDFSTGELTSRFRFKVAGASLSATVLTFCSRSHPTLSCQQIEVVCDEPCDLVVSAGIDTRAIEGNNGRILKDVDGGVDGLIRWTSCGEIATCGLAYATLFEGADNAKRSLAERQDELTTHYTLRAEPGRRYRLAQLTSAVPGVMHSQPEFHAARAVALGRKIGFERLRAENAGCWREIWRGRIRLIGAERRWQELADAAFFYLNASVHMASPASTSIFGLASWKDYHYYYGHVMWDVDTFALPVVAAFQPGAAAAMLNYRVLSLNAARTHAQTTGRLGVQFPWHSATSSGQEAAPIPGSATWYADHVTLDVALAFVRFWRLTGDATFLKEKAWPVLREVGSWISSRVKQTSRGYEFREAMGIAERKEPSNNPAFTNMSTKLVLRALVEAAEALDLTADPAWSAIERGLVLPEDGHRIVSHDDYTDGEEKGATPEPLAAIFPQGFELPPDREQATLRFYLDRADEYIGSPMLSALYGVWAAWANDRELAARLMEDGYGRFAADRFSQILEYRSDRFPEQPRAGPFFANMAGFLCGLVYGFTGVQPTREAPDRWASRRVVLPAGWDAIEIDRLCVHGRPARLVARQAAPRATLEFLQETQAPQAIAV